MKRTILALALGLSFTAFSQNLVLDETFVVGTGTNFRVNDIQQLPDSKILIAGNFETYDGNPAPGIARLNADGSFDTSFTVNLTSNNFNEAIAEPDGKVIAVGENSGIYRFNADGTPDAGFTPPSLTQGGYGPSYIARQGNKYIVTGDFQVVLPGGEIYRDMLRLNYDGTVDTTFADIEFWDSFDFGKILVQEDGKLFIAGKFINYNDVAVNNLMRLTADGALDTTFSAGTGPAGIVRAAVQLADGKYIVTGQFESYNGAPAHLMVKLNSDGTKDNSFAYLPNVGLPEDGIMATTIIKQEDGKFMMSGLFRDALINIEGIPDGSVPVYISRINADGSTDASFTGGTGFNDSVDVIAFQEDGKLLAGGMFSKFNNTDRKTLARFTQEVLSVNENSITGVKAYPNPVSTVLSIDTAATEGSIAIYDILGSRVYNGVFDTKAAIDMSALSNGVYIVKLQSGNKVFTQKIIKQ